jgi:hypothetical protein
MKIEIGKGVMPFTFGINEEDAISIQGKPDKKYQDEYEDTFLLYNSLEITLKFEKDNNHRLSWIETNNNSIQFSEFSPWDMSQVEIITRLTQILGELPHVEDYGSYQSITFNNSWLELQFEYDKLKHINFGVLTDSDSTLWPER